MALGSGAVPSELMLTWENALPVKRPDDEQNTQKATQVITPRDFLADEGDGFIQFCLMDEKNHF
jgi:hypothetical protein